MILRLLMILRILKVLRIYIKDIIITIKDRSEDECFLSSYLYRACPTVIM